jgi:hypothetical protein
VADAKQKPPTTWSETNNIIWNTPLKGRGHGSPILVGDQIFLTVADPDKQSQSLMCLDRATGKELWTTVIHRGSYTPVGNDKSSHASATPACDGERIFVNFTHKDADKKDSVFASAVSRKGELLWQKKISNYVQHMGYGVSPAVYQSLVLVSADHKGGGAVAGLDRVTGETQWKIDRPKWPNYSSPIVLHVSGKDQLFYTGCKLISGFDPLTGKKHWEIDDPTEEAVTSPVIYNDLVIISGGYPKKHITAVKADGSGKIAWTKNIRCYVPSLLVHQNHLYSVDDSGVARCLEAETGKEKWSQRLEGGDFSASPVLVGETIYAVNEKGLAFIFKANPKRYEEIAQNQLGTETFATPTICGGRIYLRVAIKTAGKRQEVLYCLGEAK